MHSTFFLFPLAILASFGIMLIILPHSALKKETLVLSGVYFIIKAILGVVFIYSISKTIPVTEYAKGFLIYFSYTVLFIAFLSTTAESKKLFKRYNLVYIIGFTAGLFYVVSLILYSIHENLLFLIIGKIVLAAAVIWQVLAYQIAIIGIYIRFRRYLKEDYSYMPSEEKADINKFIYLQVFIIISFLADVMIIFVHHLWAQIAYVTFQLIFAYGIFYQITASKPSRTNSLEKFWAFWAETDPERFNYFSPETTPEISEPITTETHDELLKKLIVYFIDEKPFLAKKLVMTDIAKALNTNRTYISQIINGDLNTTFFNFVNVFRIEEAKKQMSSNSPYNMKTIADVCGFSSYTTFTKYHKMYQTKPAKWYRYIS